MDAPVYYATQGFRTRQSLLWLTCALLFAHFNLLLLRAVRDGMQSAIIASAVWLVVLLMATTSTLRQLEALERQEPVPTPSMKLAFRAALFMPIAGTVPLIFPLFSTT